MYYSVVCCFRYTKSLDGRPARATAGERACAGMMPALLRELNIAVWRSLLRSGTRMLRGVAVQQKQGAVSAVTQRNGLVPEGTHLLVWPDGIAHFNCCNGIVSPRVGHYNVNYSWILSVRANRIQL